MGSLKTLVASHEKTTQRIVIYPEALEHMSHHRQLRWWMREGGGQLFGHVNDQEVQILRASGPYRGDSRSRCSYRSKPTAAQDAIDRFADKGFLYLGEWHTHPEEFPNASWADDQTIEVLIRRSRLRLTSVVMVIQGTAEGRSGLAIYSISKDGLIRWALPEITTHEAKSQ